MRTFHALLEAKYGTVRQAFAAWDTDGSAVLSRAEFADACGRVGWPGDASVLFEYLDADGGGTITADEVPNAF